MKKLLAIVVLGLLWCNVGLSSEHEELICVPETKMFSSDGISSDDKNERVEDASDGPSYKFTKKGDKWCILQFQECSDPVSDYSGNEINIVIDSAMDFNTNEVIEMPFIQRMKINRYTGKYVNTMRSRKKNKKGEWVEELRFMRVKGSCSLEERKF